MDELKSMLTNIQNNLGTTLNYVTIALFVFSLWFLAAQVVIFSQGWELFQGTAGRMEGGQQKIVASEPAIEDSVEKTKPTETESKVE